MRSRRCGVREYLTEFRYRGVLRFYALARENGELTEFTAANAVPGRLLDSRAYIFCYPFFEELVEHRGVQIVYHNERTCSAVAVRGCAPVAGSR